MSLKSFIGLLPTNGSWLTLLDQVVCLTNIKQDKREESLNLKSLSLIIFDPHYFLVCLKLEGPKRMICHSLIERLIKTFHLL